MHGVRTASALIAATSGTPAVHGQDVFRCADCAHATQRNRMGAASRVIGNRELPAKAAGSGRRERYGHGAVRSYRESGGTIVGFGEACAGRGAASGQ